MVLRKRKLRRILKGLIFISYTSIDINVDRFEYLAIALMKRPKSKVEIEPMQYKGSGAPIASLRGGRGLMIRMKNCRKIEKFNKT